MAFRFLVTALDLESANTTVRLSIIYMGPVMTALGYDLWYSLVRKHLFSPVALFLLALPAYSIPGGVVFPRERLAMQIAADGVVVILGVASILIVRPPKPVPAEEA